MKKRFWVKSEHPELGEVFVDLYKIAVNGAEKYSREYQTKVEIWVYDDVLKTYTWIITFHSGQPIRVNDFWDFENGEWKNHKQPKVGEASFREDVKKAWESLGFEFEWIM